MKISKWLKIVGLLWIFFGIKVSFGLFDPVVGFIVWFFLLNVIVVVALRHKHGAWLWQKFPGRELK